MSDRDIQPDVQTAALAVACRVLQCDETGRPIEGVGSPIQLAAALETFAAAVVDQAVHAAILPALRAPCCCRRTADIEHLRAQRQEPTPTACALRPASTDRGAVDKDVRHDTTTT